MSRSRLLAAWALAAVVALATAAPPAGAEPPARTAGPSSDQAAGADPAHRAEARFAASRASRQVIVRFRPGTSEATRASLRSQHEVRKVQRIVSTGVEVLEVSRGASPSNVAGRLRRERTVEYAEPNGLWRAAGVADPSSLPGSDPLLDSYWGVRNTGQTVAGSTGTADVDVNAPEAWATSTGDPNVVVAVIDTGVDIEHPDLADRIWTNRGELAGNGIDDDGNGYVDDVHGWDFFWDDSSVFDPYDGDAHGTHVAGTIAATAGNGVGGAGVAPGTMIMPLKFLGPDGGDTVGALRALDYAARMGARIANNSWGGGGYSAALEDAIRSSGMTFVAAAGNGGQDGLGDDNDAAPAYPASYDLPNVLSVAAVSNKGALTGFSNYGARSVDVAAPGLHVLSTIPGQRDLDQAIQVSSTSPDYKAMLWGFGLEDITGASSRADAVARTLSFLGTARADEVLLVDDDGNEPGSGDTASTYEAALAAAGFTSVATRTVTIGEPGPDAATMAGKTVIWQTGEAFAWPAATLTQADQDNLTTFLHGGGRLFLAGADALFQAEESAFVTDVLHTVYLGEGDVRTRLAGRDGSAFAGTRLLADGADSADGSAHPYRDGLAPADSAARVALHLPASGHADAYASYSGTSMAAPHAAGVAALVASVRPAASATEIADAVGRSGLPLPSLSGKTRTGRLVRADAAMTGYVAVTPERLLDTRGDGPQVGYVGSKPVAGQTVELKVTGRGAAAIPATAAAVAINVTGVDATGRGFVTVWPCGGAMPLAANLNLVTGATAPNLVIAKVGVEGKVCLYTKSGAHLVADVNGWFPAGSGYVPVTPRRLMDTRADGPQLGYTGAKPVAGQTVELQVTGAAAHDVPTDAEAVAINVTGVDATANGFVTVWPCGGPMPLAANLNLVADTTRPNLVIAKIGAGGKVCLYTKGGAHLVADVNGWFTRGTGYTSVTPERLLDTRADGPQVGYAGGKPAAAQVVELQVTGRGATNVPADAHAVAVNITGVDATANGFVTVWPCGTPQPLAANLNLTTGMTRPNLVVAKIGSGGKVCLYTKSGAHLVADVNGWFR